MAPGGRGRGRGRGRPRKYDLKEARMEVAVEHMAKRGLGFEEKDVRKAAAELLEEYEDDGAWFFIEMDNYRVLVDKLLEYQDHDEPMQDEIPSEHALAISAKAPSPQGETTEGQPLAITRGSSAATAENEQQGDATGIEATPEVSDKAIVTRRRRPRPCYGMIFDDEDEDDDVPQELYILTPEGIIDGVVSVPRNEENPRKRKSLWDLKPEDL